MRRRRPTARGRRGKDNVTYVARCMTRLRFNLKNRSKAKEDVVNAVSGVLGSQDAGTQFQVIIGTNRVALTRHALPALRGGHTARDPDRTQRAALLDRVGARGAGARTL